MAYAAKEDIEQTYPEITTLVNDQSENIRRTLQSEWSFNLGIKGNGWISSENSPNLTALQTSANWGKSVTSVKNTAGVMLKSKA
jgi:hypothetical protein